MTEKDLLNTVGKLYDGKPWPRPLHILKGASLVDGGADVGETARLIGTSRHSLERVAASPNRIREVLGNDEVGEIPLKKTGLILGQLVLGRCAELAFENIYRHEMHTEELELSGGLRLPVCLPN